MKFSKICIALLFAGLLLNGSLSACVETWVSIQELQIEARPWANGTGLGRSTVSHDCQLLRNSLDTDEQPAGDECWDELVTWHDNSTAMCGYQYWTLGSRFTTFLGGNTTQSTESLCYCEPFEWED